MGFTPPKYTEPKVQNKNDEKQQKQNKRINKTKYNRMIDKPQQK